MSIHDRHGQMLFPHWGELQFYPEAADWDRAPSIEVYFRPWRYQFLRNNPKERVRNGGKWKPSLHTGPLCTTKGQVKSYHVIDLEWYKRGTRGQCRFYQCLHWRSLLCKSGVVESREVPIFRQAARILCRRCDPKKSLHPRQSWKRHGCQMKEIMGDANAYDNSTHGVKICMNKKMDASNHTK